MKNLVQHVNLDIPDFLQKDIYCYGEASFEANQEMQEPLEKLYKYENQPDMREKVKEYIAELDAEIDKCVSWMEEYMNGAADIISRKEGNLEVLVKVKNDLQGRLEELV